jgi:hypothetical protein
MLSGEKDNSAAEKKSATLAFSQGVTGIALSRFEAMSININWCEAGGGCSGRGREEEFTWMARSLTHPQLGRDTSSPPTPWPARHVPPRTRQLAAKLQPQAPHQSSCPTRAVRRCLGGIFCSSRWAVGGTGTGTPGSAARPLLCRRHAAPPAPQQRNRASAPQHPRPHATPPTAPAPPCPAGRTPARPCRGMTAVVRVAVVGWPVSWPHAAYMARLPGATRLCIQSGSRPRPNCAPRPTERRGMGGARDRNR